MFSASSSQVSKLYVDDVFSTYLYDGNGSTQTITNGIDLAGQSGMVWTKARSTTGDNAIYDTVRGATKELVTSQTTGEGTFATSLTAFNSTGFSLGNSTISNTSGQIYTSWTFRNAPKFFDVVTYTGNGTTQNIAHSLGVTPGMVIVKRTNSTGNWYVYHRSSGASGYLILNSTNAATSLNGANIFGDNTSMVDPTVSQFSVGSNADVNASGGTYVAYLFAHDTGTDGMVQCGSYTTTLGTQYINLGWEPQFLLIRRTNNADNWTVIDSMRGSDPSVSNRIYANTTSAETSVVSSLFPTSTGFGDTSGVAGNTNIYLAIRIPNKPPTSGTQVFQPVTYTGTNTDNRLVNTGIKTDMAWFRMRTGSGTGYEGFVVGDRLRGQPWLKTGATQAETTTADGLDQQIVSTTEYGTAFSSMTGVFVGNNTGAAATNTNINANTTANNHIALAFKRAPGFFDVICYTGASGINLYHQLGVAPELVVFKRRDAASTSGWVTYCKPLGSSSYMLLNTTGTPTATVIFGTIDETLISLGSGGDINNTGATYVAYLFATLPGISKVGSYTGNGSSQTIDCGFTTGARFVMIKRTDSTGDWCVFDTARGIGPSVDRMLTTNTTSAEDLANDYLGGTTSVGFYLSSGLAATNASGATYIYLAVA